MSLSEIERPENARAARTRLVSAAAGSVEAQLTFITPQAEKPVFYSQAYTGGASRYRFAIEHHTVLVENLRPAARGFTLDGAGFALRHAETAVADLYDDAAVESLYFEEVRDLLTREYGARHVEIFDATRRSDAVSGAANKDGARNPAARIHVDYTETSGLTRARDTLGADHVDALLAGGARIVQVNVWRPIGGPVLRSPLALADARTVRQEDLVATDQVFPDRVGEIYHLAHHPDQRWFYAPEMTRDEVLLIKGWDSLDDGRARFTPHSAFKLPDDATVTAPRESIEVRTFVVVS